MIVELMTLSRESFLHACSQFPGSADLVQEYSICQIEHLSKVRSRRAHLHANNDKSVFEMQNVHMKE